MAWEARGSQRYYYRAARDGRRVVKQYCGSGEVAELWASGDAYERALRETQRRELHTEMAASSGPDRLAEVVSQLAETGLKTVLEAGGYHRRSGEWRRQRNGKVG
jgi:hypothetical protein